MKLSAMIRPLQPDQVIAIEGMGGGPLSSSTDNLSAEFISARLRSADAEEPSPKKNKTCQQEPDKRLNNYILSINSMLCSKNSNVDEVSKIAPEISSDSIVVAVYVDPKYTEIIAELYSTYWDVKITNMLPCDMIMISYAEQVYN